MKVAARRLTPAKVTRRTRLAGAAVLGALILVALALGVLYFLSIWPFSENEVVRRPLEDVPGEGVTYQAEDGVRIAAGWWRPDKDRPPVVILLHEENGSRVQWSALIPTLVDRGFAVLAPDLRGFGQSNTIIRDGKEEPYQLVNRQDAEPALEEDFNNWYHQEHLPALSQVPGCIAVHRFRAIEGTPYDPVLGKGPNR